MVKSQNQSRFSTLKVFNFAGGSKSDNGSLMPPPPPPKDRYYLYNKSMSSLSPNSFSMPSTPLSPGFGRPSPGPSQSTADLHEFGSSLSRSGTSGGSSAPSKRGFFGKIASRSKRNLRPATPKSSDTLSPVPTEDDGISLPWNFQHNMHVDEALTGLPPSWSTSLSDAGFSEEEIAAIQARRANISPTQYSYADRPISPTVSTGPIIANPSPRTTSLPRQYSDNASIASSYRQQLSPRLAPPPLPLHPATLRVTPIRKFSSSSRQHSDSSSFSFESGHPEAQYVYINSRNELSSHAPSESSHVSSEARSHSPVSLSNMPMPHPENVSDRQPRTPPKRIFRVVNESPGPSSPPPAYKSPAPHSTTFSSISKVGKNSYREDESGPSSFAETSQFTVDKEPAEVEQEPCGAGERELEEEEEPSPPLVKGRLGALPPRLSLHESSDLSSWSESLFSAIPSATSSDVLTPSSTSASSPPSSKSLSVASLSKCHQSPSRQVAPLRPVPSTPLNDIAEELPVPASAIESISPLWNEVMEMVRQQSPVSEKTQPAPVSGEACSCTSPAAPEQYGRVQVGAEQEVEDEEDTYLSAGLRESNRDSGMSTVTVTGPTVVRKASLARRAIANVIDRSAVRRRGPEVDKSFGSTGESDVDEDEEDEEELVFPPTPSPTQAGFQPEDTTPRIPSRHYKTPSMVSRPLPSSLTPPPAQGSPSSSYFSESGSSGYGTGSRSSSSRSDSHGPLYEEDTDQPPELPPKDHEPAYLQTSSPVPTPSPSRSTFGEHVTRLPPRVIFGTAAADMPRYGSLTVDESDVTLRGPSIVINGISLEHKDDEMAISSVESSSTPSSTSTPCTPVRRYQGWLSDVVAPLGEFIDDDTEPRDHFIDLQEIAEAESGSVYAARVHNPEVVGLAPETTFVAIKNVPILPSGSPKLVDLKKELELIKDVIHENVLTMDALYIDLVEDSLWIRMELMERSLADVVGLVADGLMVQERMIARFASDVLLALDYLQKKHIAHRDVRSDNLLLNKDGVLKIADFSNAVQVTPEKPECSVAAGVIYWQAPEMRSNKPYNALKVDVWSLGATVWETAQAEPPFAEVQDPRLIGDRWPTLRQPEIYSRSFHDFLRLCSEPSLTRPDPSKLLNTPFIRNACGRPVNIQLLSQCRAIEKKMLERENADS